MEQISLVNVADGREKPESGHAPDLGGTRI